MPPKPASITLIAAAVLFGPAFPGAALAHNLPGSTDFSIFLPEDQFTGQIMFITYIGPQPGQFIWHATADLTWVSIGGTPASDILVNFELAVDGITEHWTVTGADLGWGSGPGTYTGTINTDMLNGLVTPNGPFGSGLIFVDIGTTTGDGLSGGHFDDSSLTLELNPVPGPGTLALLAGALLFRGRRSPRTG